MNIGGMKLKQAEEAFEDLRRVKVYILPLCQAVSGGKINLNNMSAWSLQFHAAEIIFKSSIILVLV